VAAGLVRPWRLRLARGCRVGTIRRGTTVEEAEKGLILRTLEHTRNNKTRAAEILGISLKTCTISSRSMARRRKKRRERRVAGEKAQRQAMLETCLA